MARNARTPAVRKVALRNLFPRDRKLRESRPELTREDVAERIRLPSETAALPTERFPQATRSPRAKEATRFGVAGSMAVPKTEYHVPRSHWALSFTSASRELRNHESYAQPVGGKTRGGSSDPWVECRFGAAGFH